MATIYGGTGDELIQPGTPPGYVDGADLIYGYGGNDTIYSGTANDSVYGGTGNDLIYGGAGADLLYGDDGNDTLIGGTGADTLYGGAGDDTFYESDFASGGADVFYGGDGIDTIDFSGAPSGVNITLTAGNATVNPTGTNNTDTLIGFENITGTGFADIIIGDLNANVLSGGAGTDRLEGGGGNDLLYGGADNDTLYGGTGSDTLFGGAGNDQLFGDDGNDLLVGDAGADTLTGGLGDDTLRGGDGGDVLVGGTGLDFIDYSDSNAAVSINLATGSFSGGHATGDSASGVDGIIGSNFNDTLIGFDGSSTDPSDAFTNVFYGGGGDDSLSGLGGGDSLFGGADNDTVSGDGGDDLVSGDSGRDLVYGGTGNDTVYGGSENDTVYGDAGDDIVSGDAGDDTVYGGTGNDTLFGGTGRDVLYGGAGLDIIYGGDDEDRIFMSFTPTLNDVLGNESVFGGAGGADNDTLTLDITGFGWGRIDLVYDPLDSENGTIIFYGPDGVTVIGTLTFRDIENLVIVCFTAGTRITTENGPMAVEDLAPGDMVLTRDRGFQPLRWVGRRDLSLADLQARPELRPVRIAAGALGASRPDRAMLVSPQHRVLIEGARSELYFGEGEVLVPAKHLVGLAQVTRAMPADGVSYVHILFDRHEIVESDGIWTESFQPAERTLSALDIAARDEVLSLFPALADQSVTAFPAARLSLKAHEARVLISA